MMMITKFISEVAKSVINGDLAVGSRWFDDNKLVLINPEKCKCTSFRKNYPCDLSFRISDVHSGSYRRPFRTFRRNYRLQRKMF